MKFYFFLIFIFASCNTIKDINIKEPIISLQRTACFGKCPIYKFEIYSSGDCIYHGTKFVDKIGQYKFQLKKNDIDIILDSTSYLIASNSIDITDYISNELKKINLQLEYKDFEKN